MRPYSLSNLALAAALATLLAACGGPELARPEAPVVAPEAPRVPAEPPAPAQPEAPVPPPEPEAPAVAPVGDVPASETLPLDPVTGVPSAEEVIEPRPACRIAADPIGCEKRNRASERALAECQGVEARQKGDCMRDAMVRNEDCTQSRAVALCEARKYAYDTCRGTYGKERRQCLLDAMPLDDCSTAKTKSLVERCEASKKALATCAIFEEGNDRRSCMYKEMAPFLKDDKSAGD